MTVRVLSYPPVHDYVDRLHPACAELVHRDQPWPRLPDLYDPDWIVQHRRDWDVVHFHFTWEQYPVETVEEVLLAHRGTPLVWTAHDLRNPHTEHPARDLPYLALLAEHADHVITLTSGAADEIRERFDRAAQVIPHGPLLPSSDARRWRGSRRDGGRLLLHLRSVRTNVDWRTPVRVVSELDGVELDVLVLRDADGLDEIRAAAGEGVHVHVHDPLSFDELAERLVGAEALILAYLWGTHSGMVELATDLGVPVIAGDVGYLREQAPLLPVPVRRDGLDATVLADHIRGERPPPVDVESRERRLARFRHDHETVYGRLSGTAVDR